MSVADQPPSPQNERIDREKLTFLWGMAPPPISHTPPHFLATGGGGSGKTITLRLLMQSALRLLGLGSGHRALICDAKATLDPVVRGMSLRCPIHILNPFDQRGVVWDVAADTNSLVATRQLVASLIPENASTHSYFADAVRKLLKAVCPSFIETAPQKWTLRDVLLAVQTRERRLSLFARLPETATAAQSFLGDEQTCTTILQTLAAKLQPFEVVAAYWHHATEKLSLEHWLHEEGVILLRGPPFLHGSVALINQAMISHLAHLIFRQQESATRRTWFFLDEV